MNDLKEIYVLGLGIYGIIHMALWYKGKINLTERQRERREKILSEYDDLIKLFFFVVVVAVIVMLLIIIFGVGK